MGYLLSWESSFGLFMSLPILFVLGEVPWAPLTFGFRLGLTNRMNQLGIEVGVGGESWEHLLLVSLNLEHPQVATVLLSQSLCVEVLLASGMSLHIGLFKLGGAAYYPFPHILK